MPVGILFWMLMVIFLLFGVWLGWRGSPESRPLAGGNLLIFILFFLIGWKLFGFVVQ